ncbi:MAG: PAS domain S-box protein [Spirochaetota bacterium]|nr:PAS domain S-box protein [Spirochaetota bacterium]
MKITQKFVKIFIEMFHSLRISIFVAFILFFILDIILVNFVGRIAKTRIEPELEDNITLTASLITQVIPKSIILTKILTIDNTVISALNSIENPKDSTKLDKLLVKYKQTANISDLGVITDDGNVYFKIIIIAVTCILFISVIIGLVFIAKNRFMSNKLIRENDELKMQVAEYSWELYDSNERLKENIIVLKEKEELLQRFQEVSRTLLWNWDVRCQKINWFGDPTQFFGRTADELEDLRGYKNSIHPEDIGMIEKSIKKPLDDTSRFPLEYRVVQPDGTVLWLMNKGRTLYDNSSEITNILGHVTDITERKLAEEALQESEFRYRTLFERAPIAISISTLDGKLIVCNNTAYKISGYTKAELEHLNLKNAYKDPKDSKEIFNELLSKGIVRRFNIKLKRKDGQFFNASLILELFVLEGNDVILSIVEDITERIKVEEELKESEEKFRSISEQSFLAITIIQNGVIFYANKAFADIVAYSIQEIVNWRKNEFYKIVHPDDLSLVNEQGQKKGRGEKDIVTQYQFRMITKKGETRWVDIFSKIIKYRGYAAVLATIIDITNRKKAEKELSIYRHSLEALVEDRTRELEETQEKLIAAERLAVLGKVSGSISHELRNPLGVIDSSVYFLKRKFKDQINPKLDEHFNRIKVHIKRSTSIIESLINLTQMKHPVKNKLNLADVIKRVVDNSNIPQSIELSIKLVQENIFIQGDLEQLCITFQNIITNALQAMSNKGKLTIQTEVDEKRQFVETIFEDTGSGISDENIDRIFQPLFSTKAKGIGFGLSICQQIIEKHNGVIEAISKAGEGATFIIRLPLYNIPNSLSSMSN